MTEVLEEVERRQNMAEMAKQLNKIKDSVHNIDKGVDLNKNNISNNCADFKNHVFKEDKWQDKIEKRVDKLQEGQYQIMGSIRFWGIILGLLMFCLAIGGTLAKVFG